MDDFGTGYSSLSYLRSFPFDKIKIDQSFVRDLGANRDAQAIVRAIISLGIGLGVTITAEGVETEAELNCLRAEGCHEAQGFLFSRARPNVEIVALLRAQCGADHAGADPDDSEAALVA
jgi:EAL domain-containing protein (putative c-di-GMP-specific phosphodiesterase class I)